MNPSPGGHSRSSSLSDAGAGPKLETPEQSLPEGADFGSLSLLDENRLAKELSNDLEQIVQWKRSLFAATVHSAESQTHLEAIPEVSVAL